MSDAIKKTADNRHISLYPAGRDCVPFVLLSSYMEAGPEILEACRETNSPPFALVSVANLNWDEDLSPWAHEPVVSKDDHFTGQAAEYCEFLLTTVMPFAVRELGEPSYWALGGYSMGGLFALYAPYLTDVFTKLISGSGSVWYPGFVEYVRTHAFKRNPDAIYLSLGDKETRTKNPYLRTTQTAMEELETIYKELGIAATFELNHGGHYDHASRRMARGIRWCLEN